MVSALGRQSLLEHLRERAVGVRIGHTLDGSVKMIEALFHDERRQLGADAERLYVLVNDQRAIRFSTDRNIAALSSGIETCGGRSLPPRRLPSTAGPRPRARACTIAP